MGSLVYTPYTLPLVFCTVVTLLLSWFVWQRRPGLGVYPMIVLTAALALWTIAYNFEISATDIVAKRLLAGVQYIGISIIPAAWFAFALEYTGREKWLTQRNLVLLAVWPTCMSLVALTNMQHTWLYEGTRLLDFGTYSLLQTDKGIVFYVHVVVSYLQLAAGAYLLIYTLVRSPDIYRGQIVGLLVGVSTPWLANILYLIGADPLPGLDLTPFAFAISSVAFAYSMLRYRLMDIVPVARERVIEGMGDAMIVLNEKGIIVDINPAARQLLSTPDITLSSRRGFIGRPVREVLHPYQDISDRYRAVESAQTEIEVPMREGIRYFDLRISPLRNRSGNLSGRVILLHDITEFRHANDKIRMQNETLSRTNEALSAARERAEEGNRLKSEFLATISHELRTPLNAIIGFSDLMAAGIAGNLSAQQQDYVQRVLSNSERLLGLINELLDFSKLEAGRMVLVEAPFNPRETIKRIHGQLQPLADRKMLRFEQTFDAALPERLLGDEKRLEQIIVNLVINAIRFTDSGHVTIKLLAGAEDWSIQVVDTGSGIPPHALEFIFDAFRQVDGTPQREHGGTGLGLAVVRKLVQLMGGSVSVTSEVLRGSTFTVKLPLKKTDAVPDGAAKTLEKTTA
jgi:PAS domain S-box-containing protein